MKSILAIICFILLTTPVLFATQIYVVGEVFTQTWCGYCPAARSALHQMAEEEDTFPYFIPIIWQGNAAHISPGYSTRASLYGVGGIPHAQWGGYLNTVGGGAGTYAAYAGRYNQLVNNVSPVELDLSLSLNQDQLVLTAEALMTGNITTTNNQMVFILTYDLTGIMDPDYFASVKAYQTQTFGLTSTGQSETYVQSFTMDPSWDVTRVKAIALVQTFSENKVIHQAAMNGFYEMMPMFTSNVQQGPPDLFVKFYDNSYPAQNIVSWEWDLNGDGTIDSTDPNPTFLYTEPGNYSVTLTISDGEEFAEEVMVDYIVVTDSDNISGGLSGTWRSEYSPFHITGDAHIAEDSYLIIEPGVEIITGNHALTVNGHISADANEAEPIVFTSDSNWQGLRITNSLTENTFVNCHFFNASQTAMKIDNSNVTLIGNTFYNNEGAADPGAVKVTSSDELVFRNNVFSNNKSNTGIGALEINASSFDVKNNLFVNNTGFTTGAFGVKAGAAINFINNTITHNNFTASSGYQIFNFNSFLSVKNSIVRGDGLPISALANAVTLVDYCNVEGGHSGVEVIDEDPMFVSPTEGSGIEYNGLDGIWYLSDESPSVDTGNPAVAYNDPEDPANPGFARFPAKGTIRNDMGTYGGNGIDYWVNIEEGYLITKPETEARIVAFPNPFNPSVNLSLSKIEYSKDSPVSLKIYNSRGQLVKTLADNIYTNRTEFVWDGLDNQRMPSASGVYFVRFTAGDTTASKKVMLLK
jgi:PKD repeat protein